MDNQLLQLFVWTSLTHLCLSASISTVPSATPDCFPGSSYVNDCMSYTCDENGKWQEFEFTRTDECCLKSHHPACAKKDKTSSEFMVTTESPPTTTSIHMCDSGSTKAEDCRIYLCHDGQWQGFEFTATKECCLQTFHPKCQAMGFTSTGQATGVTTTAFTDTTPSPPSTTSTPLCDSGSMKSEDCRMFFCQDGQWQVGEFTATKECCLQTFHPKCQAMGFTTTGQAMDLTPTDQATSLTSIAFTDTTPSPPTTTSTPLCDSGLMKAEDCRIFICLDGQWQVGEFTATKECCLQTFHPKCQVMGFTTTGQATGFTSTGEHTGFTSSVSSSSTGSPNADCSPGSSRVQECGIYICENGQWQLFEFFASEECCVKENHPKCEHTGFTSPVSSSSTSSPNAECSPDYSHVQDCGIYICENGEWQVFEFFASEECCEKEFHPRCAALIKTPEDDGSPKDWPLDDSYSDSSEEVIDVLLIRLPMLPVLPFPVAYRNGIPLNSHKDTSGGRQ